MRLFHISLCVVLFCWPVPAQENGTLRPENITAEEIVTRMAANNSRRQHELQAYTGQREYHLLYTGFPGRHEADLVVEVRYQSPDTKDFTIISQSGSHFIINRVFKKILETEREAADQRNQASTAPTDQNYRFELLGVEDVEGRPAYVLHLEPKIENRLLYRGRIWVDAADFALCKIDGEPAKRPSIWISNVEVHHRYKKIGEFWLPAENESNTDVRLGGHATLSIHYGDYKVVSEVHAPASGTSSGLAGAGTGN